MQITLVLPNKVRYLSNSPSHPIVVSLLHSSQSRNASLIEEVLGEVRDSLLRDHEIWLETDNRFTHLSNGILLLEYSRDNLQSSHLLP